MRKIIKRLIDKIIFGGDPQSCHQTPRTTTNAAMKGFGSADDVIEERYCDVELEDLEGVALVVDPRSSNARRASRPLGPASHWNIAASASRFKSSSGGVGSSFNRLGASSMVTKKRAGLLVTLLVLVFGGVYYLGLLESKDETIVRNGEVAAKKSKKKKKGKVGSFYGLSHYAPTPSITTIQQLGLGITHAFSTLIINSFKKLVHSQTSPAFDHYDFLLPRDQIVGLLLDNSLDVEM